LVDKLYKREGGREDTESACGGGGGVGVKGELE